jgi:molybdopterin converting factor small subunit
MTTGTKKKIKLFGYFQRLAQGREIAEVEGDTVRQCMESLIDQFPDLGKEIFDQNGKPHRHISIFVSGRRANSMELAEPVKEGDSLSLMLNIVGG